MALPTRVARALDLPFENVQRDLDTLVNRLFNGREGSVFAPYGVDVREDQDHIYVEAELPGFSKDEVDITLENSTLTISAERKTEQQQPGKEQKPGEFLLNERRYTRFLRSFTLPPTVDEGSVQANLKDGVLHVTLNKREETKPRKIKVS
ncbi:MAG TPA: Hsp20/alpha crystallin family protein [Tepidisphaeraceae bacterium]|jgi:HSP20 family protein